MADLGEYLKAVQASRASYRTTGLAENFISWREVFGDPVETLTHPSDPARLMREYVRDHLGLNPDDYVLVTVWNAHGWYIYKRADLP